MLIDITLVLGPCRPSQPLFLTLGLVTSTSITLSWSEPMDPGGVPIDEYLVFFRGSMQPSSSLSSTHAASPRTATRTTTLKATTTSTTVKANPVKATRSTTALEVNRFKSKRENDGTFSRSKTEKIATCDKDNGGCHDTLYDHRDEGQAYGNTAAGSLSMSPRGWMTFNRRIQIMVYDNVRRRDSCL
jgi:hypothetical protein